MADRGLGSLRSDFCALLKFKLWLSIYSYLANQVECMFNKCSPWSGRHLTQGKFLASVWFLPKRVMHQGWMWPASLTHCSAATLWEYPAGKNLQTGHTYVPFHSFTLVFYFGFFFKL